MSKAALATVLHDLRRSAVRRDEAGLTDAALLQEYVANGDEAAFEALLVRHGAMVLGVCRRVLRNESDAADAFQATFLVLVRKAASIQRKELLGNWLYGVAHHTALRARTMSTKRSARERAAAARQRTEVSAAKWRELEAALDEELQALPERYRAALVLCDLEGKSIKDAARQLGCPAATIGTRLARGRRLLAQRLADHGLALSGGALAAALTHSVASAAVPSGLIASTMTTASLFAAGQAAAGQIPATVAALTKGTLKTMFLQQLKTALGAVLITAMVCSLAGEVYHRARAAEPQTGAPVQQGAGNNQAQPPGNAGAEKAPLSLKARSTAAEQGTGVLTVAFSPDGKWLASGGDDGSIKIWDPKTGKEVATWLGHQDCVRALAFSPDGKVLASSSHGCKGGDKAEPAAAMLWEVGAWQEKVKLDDSEGAFHHVAFSPDGKVLAATDSRQVKLWDTATGKRLGTLKETDRRLIRAIVFSPDNKTLLVGTRDYDGEEPLRLWAWRDLKANGSIKMEGECRDLHFARDGKTLVTLNEYGDVTFWDYENARPGKTVKAGRADGWAGQPHRFALSADGKRVALGYATMQGDDYAGKVDVRDTATGELLTSHALDTVIGEVAFHPAGTMLAAGGLKNATREKTLSAVWLQGTGGVVTILDVETRKQR